MIENARHVVEKPVLEEQAHGREAQQSSEAQASEMRQHILLLEQQQGYASDAQQQLLYEC
eukprot:12122015-Prorocentrum_lima.AAC.1